MTDYLLNLRNLREIISNRVHEALLSAVEDDDGEEHSDAQHGETVEEACDVKGAGAEATVFERLEDWSEGVEVYYPSVAFRSKAEGIYDRGGIHEELYAELYEELQVAVFRCPG